jgi:hypothetical protein
VNPRTIRWQAAVTAVLLLVAALAASPAAVLWMAAPALLLAVALNIAYAGALGRRGRPSRRLAGDRWVARYVMLGLGIPLAMALVLLGTDVDPAPHVVEFAVAEVAALAIAPAALFVLILCSSLVDWYYICPRIDGIIRTPPCRSPGSDVWKRPTRWWYLHRGLATLAYFGFALVVAFVVMLMLVREHQAAAGIIGGVGGLAGLLLIFTGSYRAELPTVARHVLSPAYCLGDDLRYEAYRWRGRGFVLHVAVPVTKLIPLDEQGQPTGEPFVERKNSALAEADLQSLPPVACATACARLNPRCSVGSPRLDRRRRLLIV